MPTAEESKLKEVARKYAKAGKLHRKKGESLKEAEGHLVYGIMTNQQKRGSIPPWRKLKK